MRTQSIVFLLLFTFALTVRADAPALDPELMSGWKREVADLAAVAAEKSALVQKTPEFLAWQKALNALNTRKALIQKTAGAKGYTLDVETWAIAPSK